MTIFSTVDAKENFDALLDQAQRGPVCIRRDDHDVAVVISPDEYEQIRQLRSRELIQAMEGAAHEAEANGLTEEVLRETLADC